MTHNANEVEKINADALRMTASTKLSWLDMMCIITSTIAHGITCIHHCRVGGETIRVWREV